jgi:hypothetical protein
MRCPAHLGRTVSRLVLVCGGTVLCGCRARFYGACRYGDVHFCGRAAAVYRPGGCVELARGRDRRAWPTRPAPTLLLVATATAAVEPGRFNAPASPTSELRSRRKRKRAESRALMRRTALVHSISDSNAGGDFPNSLGRAEASAKDPALKLTRQAPQNERPAATPRLRISRGDRRRPVVGPAPRPW